MRPLRFLLTLTTSVLAFFLLLYIGPFQADQEAEFEERSSSIGAYFNWRTPSSLFPPSAVISLTDDNSTFFLARPAAFGPLLPTKSLSGQLWIGSGFGDDHLGRGGSGAGAEGELGCSDVPGWSDGSYRGSLGSGRDARIAADRLAAGDTKSRRSLNGDEDGEDEDNVDNLSEDDGTDDHLHHPLPASDEGKTAGKPRIPAHADIQSLQESAEIAGKVVLLSRGGCGFLEKVKWVQRRGGVALIVGDDIRGGPLVTMYARGDTSNVTIPSLFTSHTTAHLLSSLIPSGGILEDLEEAARLGYALADLVDSANIEHEKNGGLAQKHGLLSSSAARKTMAFTAAQSRGKNDGEAPVPDEEDITIGKQRRGWFKSVYGSRSVDRLAESRRGLSSGRPGWVRQDDLEDEEPPQGKIGKVPPSSTSSSRAPTSTSKHGSSDDFQIGVQDWRDPDLVAAEKEHLRGSSSISSSSTKLKKVAAPTATLKGGSITPGSGEYWTIKGKSGDMANPKKTKSKSSASEHENGPTENSRGWFSRLFHSHTEDDTEARIRQHESAVLANDLEEYQSGKDEALASSRQRLSTEQDLADGLWVTLTPTSMSSSPFFDTLLVLVVSPLVTLTVVYALLLLRSRIRRRRWRAPKSVVERLPVRTYQTMSSTTSTTSSSSTSALASPTATTPLLPVPASQPITARPRPRAPTAGDLPRGSSSASHRSEDMASPSLEQIEEKRAAGLAEWRRRYGGKQRECVVCLEEYVDGVSRVMSLPCGHEFHAECITPWLTTRRRTCPICKGDVVRSLARAEASHSSTADVEDDEDDADDSALAEAYTDVDTDADAIQDRAATTVNEDPAALRPVPVSREEEDAEDLERG